MNATKPRTATDAPLNGVTLVAGRYHKQCVRCGRRWEIQMTRPDNRNGMCVDCFDVDPEFGLPKSRGGVL